MLKVTEETLTSHQEALCIKEAIITTEINYSSFQGHFWVQLQVSKHLQVCHNFVHFKNKSDTDVMLKSLTS